jgi:hypothetical protein
LEPAALCREFAEEVACSSATAFYQQRSIIFKGFLRLTLPSEGNRVFTPPPPHYPACNPSSRSAPVAAARNGTCCFRTATTTRMKTIVFLTQYIEHRYLSHHKSLTEPSVFFHDVYRFISNRNAIQNATTVSSSLKYTGRCV